jgi:hypothetical protein
MNFIKLLFIIVNNGICYISKNSQNGIFKTLPYLRAGSLSIALRFGEENIRNVQSDEYLNLLPFFDRSGISVPYESEMYI